MRVAGTALILLIPTLATPGIAASNNAVTARSLTGCWSLIRETPWPAYTFCFDGGSNLDVQYLGHMSNSATEGADGPAKYRIVGSRITLQIGALDYYWPWEGTKLSCRLGLSGKDVMLTDCRISNPRARAMTTPDIHFQLSPTP